LTPRRGRRSTPGRDATLGGAIAVTWNVQTPFGSVPLALLGQATGMSLTFRVDVTPFSVCTT